MSRSFVLLLLCKYPWNSSLKFHDQCEFLTIEVTWKSQNHLHRETFASFFILTSKPYADCRYEYDTCSVTSPHIKLGTLQLPARKMKIFTYNKYDHDYLLLSLLKKNKSLGCKWAQKDLRPDLLIFFTILTFPCDFNFQ